MDLVRYGKVLWRWRNVTVFAIVAAVVISVLATYRLDGGTLTPRNPAQFESSARVLVERFDRPLLDARYVRAGEEEGAVDGPSANELTQIYAFVAVSDRVKERVERTMGEFGPFDGVDASVAGDESQTGSDAADIPVLEITAESPDPGRARVMAQVVAEELIEVVTQQQENAGLPLAGRVHISMLEAPGTPERTSGSPVMQMLLLLALTGSGAIALVFVLENTRVARAAQHAEGGDPDPVDRVPEERRKPDRNRQSSQELIDLRGQNLAESEPTPRSSSWAFTPSRQAPHTTEMGTNGAISRSGISVDWNHPVWPRPAVKPLGDPERW